MIRRGLWLTAGAVTGIYAYRRVSALGHRLSARLDPAGATQEAALIQGARLARQGRRGAVTAARETYRFTRDVREGMALYTARRSAPADSTLSTDHATTYEPEDGH